MFYRFGPLRAAAMSAHFTIMAAWLQVCCQPAKQEAMTLGPAISAVAVALAEKEVGQGRVYCMCAGPRQAQAAACAQV